MRLIDADALVRELNKDFHDPKIDCLIHAAPTVDAVPVVRSAWEIITDEYGNELMRCPVCRSEYYDGDNDTVDTLPNHCPNCGTKMDGERRSGDV